MTGTTLDHVLAFILPLFLKGAGGDEMLARRAAIQLLESYCATTDRSLLLAAEVIAFSFTTLDNLAQSVANPDLSITTRLRLRSNANALSRAADRNRQALERIRTTNPEPLMPPTLQSAEAPSAIQKVQDAIVAAAPSLARTLASAGQTLSRQQRRFLSRKVEQARISQEREARKTARLAPRATATA
jgi:hypothetical protein